MSAGTPSQMTVDQELAAAVAFVSVGLDRIRDVATRADDITSRIAAVRALRDLRDPGAGVVAAFADTIGALAAAITDAGYDVDHAADLLEQAQACAHDSIGDCIDRAIEVFTALPRCTLCGQQTPDVKVMPDPFVEALNPDSDDHEQMSLCHTCAVARFEES